MLLRGEMHNLRARVLCARLCFLYVFGFMKHAASMNEYK